jgi:hypothetical protein
MSADDRSGEGDVVLLIRTAGAVVVVTAALTRYVVELAAGAARSAWAGLGAPRRAAPVVDEFTAEEAGILDG